MICDDIWYMIYVVLCLFFVIKFCFLSFWDSTCCRSMRSCRSLTDQPSFRPFRAWHVANIRSRTILAPTWWNSGNILVLRVALELNTSTGTTKGASCHLQGAYVGVFSYCTAECMIVNLCIQSISLYIIIHLYAKHSIGLCGQARQRFALPYSFAMLVDCPIELPRSAGHLATGTRGE